MTLPLALTGAAAAGTIANASINVGAAAKKLYNSLDRNTAKSAEIRKLSSERKILPEGATEPGTATKLEEKYVYHPLMDYINNGCTLHTSGNSHVVYAPPSVGKTTACRAFMEVAAPERKMQALMITNARSNRPYLTHLAAELDVKNEEDTLMVLVDGMRTKSPSPASMLILDEMNVPGPDDCNIELVDTLMRYIYSTKKRIHFVVVTQNRSVADRLANLNLCQKIGPLEGLTIPTRSVAAKNRTTEIKWDSAALSWTLKSLTELVDKHPEFKDQDLQKESGVYPWLEEGMTPTEAEQATYKHMDDMLLEEDQKKAKETGKTVEGMFDIFRVGKGTPDAEEKA